MSKSDTTDDTGRTYQRQISRRNLLKVSGAAAGTAAGVGTANVYAVDEAEAIAATTAIGLSIVGGAAAGYLINEGVDAVTGDNYNKDDYQNATAEEAYIGIYESAASAAATDDTVRTTINNRLADSENVAWSKGKIAGLDEFDKGNAKSTAKTKAKAAIDNYYSVIQTNVANHFTEQVNKVGLWHDTIANTSNLSFNEVFSWSHNSAAVDSPFTVKTESITLLNGDSIQTSYIRSAASTGHAYIKVSGVGYDSGSYDLTKYQIEPHTNQEATAVYEPLGFDTNSNETKWKTVWNNISSKASTMKTNIEAYLDTLYSNYAPGEVDTSQFQDPTTVASQLGALEGQSGSYAYAGAEISMLGLESTFNQLMRITLIEDDVTVDGQLYFKGGPNGGIEVGTLYTPSQFTGAVYIGYESNDGNSQFAELEQSFRVEEATDLDGNQLDAVNGNEYNNQTSEVNLTEEQLNSIATAIDDTQAKQEAAAQGDGGGGGDSSAFGFSFGGDSNIVLLAGAGVAAYLIGSD